MVIKTKTKWQLGIERNWQMRWAAFKCWALSSVRTRRIITNLLLAELAQKVAKVRTPFQIYEFVNDMSCLYLNCDVLFSESLLTLIKC